MTTRMHRFVSAFALTVSLFAQFVSSAQDQPPLHQAELVRVIDGDTVVLDLHLGLDIWKRKLHCRLVGIDAPELRPRRLPKDATPAQRKARSDGIRRARKAKAALQQLLKGKTLRVRLHGKDRYGRALITLFAGKTDVGQWLIEHGHAKLWKEEK